MDKLVEFCFFFHGNGFVERAFLSPPRVEGLLHDLFADFCCRAEAVSEDTDNAKAVAVEVSINIF